MKKTWHKQVVTLTVGEVAIYWVRGIFLGIRIILGMTIAGELL